jgi:glycine cleavage system pyridoxal-binding protein P
MSGRKNFLTNFHLTSAQSMAASFTSSVMNIQGLDNVYVQMNCVGTPSGSFAIQVSADYKKEGDTVTNAGNFVSLSLPQTPTCAGADIYLGVMMQQLGAHAMQVVYTRTAGTGTCDIWVDGKMI